MGYAPAAAVSGIVGGRGDARVPGNRDGLKYQDEARALDIVKRAVFLVFEDTELAWALLEKVRGASVREMFAAGPTGETAVRGWQATGGEALSAASLRG